MQRSPTFKQAIQKKKGLLPQSTNKTTSAKVNTARAQPERPESKMLDRMGGHVQLLEEQIHILNNDKQELSMLCEEKEAELDRLKTTVDALKQQVVLF